MRVGPFEVDSIVCGDCRELAPQVPDGAAALVFNDPPYWVDFKYGNGKSDTDMDFVSPAWIVRESLRIGACALVTPGMRRFYDYPPADWLYGWFKPGSTRRSAVLNGFNTWEPVLVYGKPGKRVYQDSSYLPGGKSLNGPDVSFHGCPKPTALLEQLIERFTEPGGLVVDFFMGSGTTAIAAKRLGRRFLGFEIDPGFVERAMGRVMATTPPLFTPQATQAALI